MGNFNESFKTLKENIDLIHKKSRAQVAIVCYKEDGGKALTHGHPSVDQVLRRYNAEKERGEPHPVALNAFANQSLHPVAGPLLPPFDLDGMTGNRLKALRNEAKDLLELVHARFGG